MKTLIIAEAGVNHNGDAKLARDLIDAAVEAGADSAIMDPTTAALGEIFTMDRDARPYQLAEDVLLGKDEYCAAFLQAYRKGELNK